jgi:hypothetical protein
LPAAVFLSLLARVAGTLRALAQELRSSPFVTRVDRKGDFQDDGERPSIEWYVDAELANGEALSFRLLLYAQGHGWIIESDVRRIHKEGSDVEVELATRRALDDDLPDELVSAALQLAGTANRLRLSS